VGGKGNRVGGREMEWAEVEEAGLRGKGECWAFGPE